MKKTLKIQLLALVGMFISSAIVSEATPAADPTAGKYSTNWGDGKVARWPTTGFPIRYWISKEVPEAYRILINSAFGKWALACSIVFDYRGINESTGKIYKQDGGSIVYYGRLGDGPLGELAHTHRWRNGDGTVVTEVDICFDSETNWGSDYDFLSVAIHEAGHFVQLYDVTKSTFGVDYSQWLVMWNPAVPKNEPGGMKTDLALGDIDGARFLYPIAPQPPPKAKRPGADGNHMHPK